MTTSACSRTTSSGSWGTASLLTSSQANFAQGRQVALSGTTALQSAAWSNVSPGTYTVIVMCRTAAPAGTQSVIVAPAVHSHHLGHGPRPRAVSWAASAAPTKDYGPVTLGGGRRPWWARASWRRRWYLRRRAKPHRL